MLIYNGSASQGQPAFRKTPDCVNCRTVPTVREYAVSAGE